MMPRCGVPDIIDGKTRMHAAGSYINIQYAYFDGAPKWPYTRGYLNWGLQPGTKTDVIGPIRDYALKSWTGEAPFAYNLLVVLLVVQISRLVLSIRALIQVLLMVYSVMHVHQQTGPCILMPDKTGHKMQFKEAMILGRLDCTS
jgi:hypothetical protein